jgi:hypothetical protein
MRLKNFKALSALGLTCISCSQANLLSRISSQEAGSLGLLDSDASELQLGESSSLLGPQSCDVTLSGPICYSGQRQALLPDAVPTGLVGHWAFDSDSPVDSSGNGNNGVTELMHGPAPAGNGHSASFAKTFMMVPNSASLNNDDFTYSFWIYLVDDNSVPAAAQSATWCPLIRKGIHEPKTQQFAASPALLFSRKTGYLRAEVTTSVKGTEDGEFIDSNARLLPNRWVHIALVRHSSRSTLLLYVNGILDTALRTAGAMVKNHYPLYVGGDPFTLDQCGFTIYIDELRVFSHSVPPHQLQAEAAPALGGTDPNYVRLGCMKCKLADAVKSCPANRHICTSLELHTGGYQVARAVGWLTAGTTVWTHAAVTKGAAAEQGGQNAGQSSFGLGLCCEGPA